MVVSMIYAEVKSREITIIVEKAQRSEKIVVWGTFYHIENGKSFQCYFDNMEKAMNYYNKKINVAIKSYMEKCEMILNR